MTAAGADEGIDVEATGVVAQVKFQVAPVGREKLQQLYGEASKRGVSALFFASGGYARTAREWASGHVALFTFTAAGTVSPANAGAEELALRLGELPADGPDLVRRALASPDLRAPTTKSPDPRRPRPQPPRLYASRRQPYRRRRRY